MSVTQRHSRRHPAPKSLVEVALIPRRHPYYAMQIAGQQQQTSQNLYLQSSLSIDETLDEHMAGGSVSWDICPSSAILRAVTSWSAKQQLQAGAGDLLGRGA